MIALMTEPCLDPTSRDESRYDTTHGARECSLLYEVSRGEEMNKTRVARLETSPDVQD